MDNSLSRDTIYGLLQSDGEKVTLKGYISGQADFSNGLPATSATTQIVKAVKLSDRLSREFFKSSETVVDKYETPFVIDASRLRFKIEPSDQVLTSDGVYNIKSIRKIDKSIWVLDCTALAGERRE